MVAATTHCSSSQRRYNNCILYFFFRFTSTSCAIHTQLVINLNATFVLKQSFLRLFELPDFSAIVLLLHIFELLNSVHKSYAYTCLCNNLMWQVLICFIAYHWPRWSKTKKKYIYIYLNFSYNTCIVVVVVMVVVVAIAMQFLLLLMWLVNFQFILFSSSIFYIFISIVVVVVFVLFLLCV